MSSVCPRDLASLILVATPDRDASSCSRCHLPFLNLTPIATMTNKVHLDDFALFGGEPLFATIRSISNLVRPDIEKFLAYSRVIFEDERYSEGRVEKMLEARLADFHQVKHCISFCGGFWGLV